MVNRQQMTAWPWAAMVLLVGSALVGCTGGEKGDPGVLVGLHQARDTGATTAKFSYDAEVIDSAELVREDTSPRWQLGRYAYTRGANRVLLITRTTTVNEPGQSSRFDKVLERVWITIPAGTEEGDVLYLEELEPRYLVGYDVGESGVGIFIEPNRVIGTVTLLEQDEYRMKFDIQMSVRPRRRLTWEYQQVTIAPLRQDGKYATLADPRRVIRPSTAAEAHLPYVMPDRYFTQRTDRWQPDPATGPGSQDGSVEPANGNGQETQPDADNGPEPATQQTLIGQWITDTQSLQYRFQFNTDGTFVMAATRGGGNYAPGMHRGTYRIQDDFVIMHIRSLYFDNMDHTHFIKQPYNSLRYSFDNRNLVLRGALDVRGTVQDLNLVLQPASYPDMTRHVPPRARDDSDVIRQ